MPFELRDRPGADHTAVGHQTDPLDTETPTQPLGHRDQRFHIRGIARPQFTGDRPTVAIKHRTDNELIKIQAVILAVTALAQALAACALEVDRGGIEEYQLQLTGQVPASREPNKVSSIRSLVQRGLKEVAPS